MAKLTSLWTLFPAISKNARRDREAIFNLPFLLHWESVKNRISPFRMSNSAEHGWMEERTVKSAVALSERASFARLNIACSSVETSMDFVDCDLFGIVIFFSWSVCMCVFRTRVVPRSWNYSLRAVASDFVLELKRKGTRPMWYCLSSNGARRGRIKVEFDHTKNVS